MIDSWITVLIEPTVSVFLPVLLAIFLDSGWLLHRGWKVIAWREGGHTLMEAPPGSSSYVSLSFLHPQVGCQQAEVGLF